jgi:MFS transporter, ACS family, tartrate transporter
MTTPTISSVPLANRTRRRIMGRIVPYLTLLYMTAWLDRVNVSYAALEMTKDLGFTAAVYGFGAGIFFLGYFLLEIPGTIIVETWSARKWIARIMISWGILASLTGLVNTPTQFYWIRFLLGLAEAGFAPGIIVYISHWFCPEDRAKAIALFLIGGSIANILGAPTSGLLLGANWLGLAGWRWLFILEGLPAVLLGIITLFYLTDRPQQAKWLLPEERDWLTAELEKEKKATHLLHINRIWSALAQREVLLLALIYFLMNIGVYGLSFWTPTIVKKLSGLSNFQATLITVLPSITSIIIRVIVSWSSDRTGERRYHTMIPMIVTSLALLVSAATQDYVAIVIIMFCVALSGLTSSIPCFWPLATRLLTGTAGAAAIGLINSIGNLSGFFGPSVIGYIKDRTNSFAGGMIFLSIMALAAALLVVAVQPAKNVLLEVETPA